MVCPPYIHAYIPIVSVRRSKRGEWPTESHRRPSGNFQHPSSDSPGSSGGGQKLFKVLKECLRPARSLDINASTPAPAPSSCRWNSPTYLQQRGTSTLPVSVISAGDHLPPSDFLRVQLYSVKHNALTCIRCEHYETI